MNIWWGKYTSLYICINSLFVYGPGLVTWCLQLCFLLLYAMLLCSKTFSNLLLIIWLFLLLKIKVEIRINMKPKDKFMLKCLRLEQLYWTVCITRTNKYSICLWRTHELFLHNYIWQVYAQLFEIGQVMFGWYSRYAWYNGAAMFTVIMEQLCFADIMEQLCLADIMEQLCLADIMDQLCLADIIDQLSLTDILE